MKKEDLEKILDENDFSWIKVKKYKDDDQSKSFQERLYMFEEHHENETKFLIEKCRELAKQLLDAKAEIDALPFRSFKDIW